MTLRTVRTEDLVKQWSEFINQPDTDELFRLVDSELYNNGLNNSVENIINLLDCADLPIDDFIVFVNGHNTSDRLSTLINYIIYKHKLILNKVYYECNI